MASASAPAPAHVAPDEDAPDLRTPQGVDLLRARLEDPDWRVRVRALGVMATALAPPERAIDAEALAELRHEDAAFREELSGKLERDRDAFVAVGDKMGWSSHGAVTRDRRHDSSEETTREDERLAKTRFFLNAGTRALPDARAELDGGRRSRGASPARTAADPSAAAATMPASPMASPRKRSGGLCGCGSAADAAEPTRVAPPSGARAVVESADARSAADAKTTDAKAADAKTADLKTRPASASGVVSERPSEPDRPDADADRPDEDPPLDPAAVTRLLHACAPRVARAVGDLREDVRVAACGAIKAACDAANERVELSRIVSPVAAEVFAPALLRVASREADPAASNAAFFALARCASACAEPSFLRRVCDAYARCRGSRARGAARRARAGDGDGSPPRNELLRRRALELVARALADWPSRVLTDENADCLACATTCVLDGLEDPSAGVRRAARACFEVYEAVWPRRAEALVFELRPHARQLVLGGSLAGDPDDARDGAGVRWAVGGARAFARRETRDGRVAVSAERDARRDERTSVTLDAIPGEAERRLAAGSPDRRGRSIAASRPVAWPSPPPSSPKAPAPPPLWDPQRGEMPSPTRAHVLAEVARDAAARDAAAAAPLAAYHDAARRRGTREVSAAGRYTRWLAFPKSRRFGYSSAPEVIEQYSNLETRLEDDVQKLDLRLREAHALNVRARVHGAYAETLEKMVTDRATGEAVGVVDRRGNVARVSSRSQTECPYGFETGARASSPARSVDSEGLVEARWREPPSRGHVRDLATGAIVETEAYLARWAPSSVDDSSREGASDGAFGALGKENETGVAGVAGGKPSAEPRTAEVRARALRRIRAEWHDEVADVFGDHGSAKEPDGTAVRRFPLPDAATKPPPTEAEARAARARDAAGQAKALREARAFAFAKEEEETKRYRELRARQEARVTEAEMRREDDARALELLRLRNENALLKHKYDALFHERLIKPGDVVVDAGMTPGKAQTLSSNANANANANTSDWRGVLDPGARVVRTRVFRGATVRGEGGVDVDVKDSRRDPLSYPGSFRREIEARKADIERRKRFASVATRGKSGGAASDANPTGRWDGVVDWR